MGKLRADLFLVEKGHAPSRSKAQDLIKKGAVSIRYGANIQAITSSSELIDVEKSPEILINQSEIEKFVSRAGYKLEGAINHLKLSVKDLVILDVGISTGGFTDCLLQNGASKVVGIDVGHNQLAEKLKSDQRVICLEGVNARGTDTEANVLSLKPEKGFPLVVIDVSFISLTLVLPAVAKLVRYQGHILALVKPQFEVGPEGLAKGGIVKNTSLYFDVEQKIKEAMKPLRFNVVDYFSSSIEGKDGNREFFIFAKKDSHD